MSDKPNILAVHRSSLTFVSGLGLAALLAVSADGVGNFRMRSHQTILSSASDDILRPQQPRDLTEADHAAAVRAWSYMVANTRPETGLVDSVAGYPSTTLWDQGSYIFALVAAKNLNLIDDATFHSRVQQLLKSLKRLPLYAGQLPNKAYNTKTLNMVDYTNAITENGIGWSALDIARMLLSFRALEKLNSEYGSDIRSILAGWDLNAMAAQGELWGVGIEDEEARFEQEGRLGYEQYGARSAALWGLDVLQAISASRALEWTTVEGIEVPRDVRYAQSFRAITPILSEPFILQAVEMGLDSESQILADRIYRAQEARYRSSGIPTMVSEDHINQEPYFLYSSVFSNGEPWAVVTESGDFYPELRTLSVKAVFAWDAIYDTEYTALMREQITGIKVSKNGWPAGIYEQDGSVNDIYTLNTNAVVLEALHFKGHGPLWAVR